jgi:hypothetical protein
MQFQFSRPNLRNSEAATLSVAHSLTQVPPDGGAIEMVRMVGGIFTKIMANHAEADIFLAELALTAANNAAAAQLNASTQSVALLPEDTAAAVEDASTAHTGVDTAVASPTVEAYVDPFAWPAADTPVLSPALPSLARIPPKIDLAFDSGTGTDADFQFESPVLLRYLLASSGRSPSSSATVDAAAHTPTAETPIATADAFDTFDFDIFDSDESVTDGTTEVDAAAAPSPSSGGALLGRAVKVARVRSKSASRQAKRRRTVYSYTSIGDLDREYLHETGEYWFTIVWRDGSTESQLVTRLFKQGISHPAVIEYLAAHPVSLSLRAQRVQRRKYNMAQAMIAIRIKDAQAVIKYIAANPVA